jgi:hypothetical protein
MTRMCTLPLLALVVLLLPGWARGSEASGDRSLEVRGPATERILVLETPAVTGDHYAITGTVAYSGVEGEGYLEMWSYFPDGSRYFSRTLEPEGPLGGLHGSSPERPFALPFFLTPGGARPARLEVNVVLPAAGHVILRGLRLGSAAEASAAGAWWSAQTGGLIGGVAGSAVGLLGALVGTLCSLGRGRRLAMAALLALGLSGLALLALGALALALGQPYEVWYPLVLTGVLDPVLAFSLLPVVRRRFEAAARRGLHALDARG